jgi:hypothetical protein
MKVLIDEAILPSGLETEEGMYWGMEEFSDSVRSASG